ncbi:MAG TPA: methyltransferase [Bacteroidales bacterium]|jgi:caffeoyl-CoA O-methyltransferase|nr:methyltransferase [Bacteroidales bacterium]
MLIDSRLEEYILSNTSKEDPLLAELRRETHLKVLNPRMLSGHPQGKLLEMISKMLSPNKILEIGTYTGYSGICLARGLKKGGHLHTIEVNDEITRFPKKYFEKAGLSGSTTIHCGDALKIIPALNETFDLVFIDADKKQYLDYFNLCIKKMPSGGILLADNVLWSGKVLKQADINDPETQSILEFNKAMVSDSRVETIILPIRDGISIVRIV